MSHEERVPLDLSGFLVRLPSPTAAAETGGVR
jgi:hypothetical protein